MNSQLKILIATHTYAETAAITPLLREIGCSFTLLTDTAQIEALAQRADFDALFVPIRDLQQANPHFLKALKCIPEKVPVFFIADTANDATRYECSGIKALDTLVNGDSMETDTLRCLRIARHLRPTKYIPRTASNDPALKPLYAQLSNIRMINKLMLEETSRERLIKQTCNHMANVSGYQHVWINLQQHHGGHRTHSGRPDVHKETKTFLTSMPHCVDLARLHIPQIITVHEGECTDCPFRKELQNHVCLYHPLKHKGEMIGELCVLIDLDLVSNSDFMLMFKQMADDLAYATSILTKQSHQKRLHKIGAIQCSDTLNYIRQLEQADQRFQALFREMPRVAVQGYNKKREVIFWNKASEDFYGFSEAEALGEKIENLILPDFMIEFATQAIQDWDEKGIPIPAAECSLKHKNGHFVPVFSSHAGFNNLNGDFEMYCLDINLSDIKEAQVTAEKLSKFPSENPNPVMRVNLQGEILYANPASERLLKLWNKQTGDIIPDEYLERANMANQDQRVIYHPIPCEEQTYNAAFTPINHGAEYLNIYAMDVTDREIAFAQLDRAKQLAEAANLAKNDFLANMSHELRTPLNGIMGMAQLLEMTPLTTDQHDEVVSIIASAHTLLDVITDILDITAIENEQLILKKESFNLKQTLQQAMNSIEPASKQKQLALSFEYPANQPELFIGDKQRITQIAINLLSNAVKFTDTGSVTLSTSIKNSHARIAVTDTGIGIPAAKQEHIFEKFTQIDTSRTRRHGGSGLGLNIAKHLSEGMGGKINVHSAEGAGSTFTLTLPLPEARDTTKPSSRAAAQNARFSTSVLLAEDNHVNQLVAKKMLMSLGCTVEISATGAEALTRANENDYDLILMDIQMPEMNGLDATRAIRQIKGLRGQVPIVALTAHAMHKDIDECQEAGMNAYLSKPIKYDNLATTLEKILSPKNDTA